MPSKSDGAAAHHVPHRLQVAGKHPVSIELAVLISLLLEDICQLYHEMSFTSSLMASTAGDWAFSVRWV